MPNSIIVTSGTHQLRKLTKTQVCAVIRNTGSFDGYMCGNYVNPFHIAAGWHLGCAVAFTNTDEFEKFVEEFNTGLHVYSTELGRYAHYYERIPEAAITA